MIFICQRFQIRFELLEQRLVKEMTDRELKEQYRKAFGWPETTQKKVMAVLEYKSHTSIRPFFFGLTRRVHRYYTDEVIDRLLMAREYE